MKPHICYALPPFEHYSPQSGGALATITFNHARELLKRGYRVSVLAPQFGGEFYDVGQVVPLAVKHREDLNIVRRFHSSKVRGRARKYDLPYFEYYLRVLQQELRQLNPDVVILFNDLSSSREIKDWLPQSKIIVTLHNEHMRSRQTEKYFQLNLEATDQIWCVSDYLRDVTRRSFGGDATKISTLYNGVDADDFSPRADYLETPRGAAPLRVLYVGRTDATKGTDLVPRSVSQLRAEGENVELTVAGSTWFYDHERQNERPYIRELRAAMEQAQAVYLGHVARPSLPAVFRSCDVACVPSRFQEPFGLAALEGMASGCALIAARRGGLPEVCGDAALMIEPNAPDELTNALRKLMANRELLWQYKERARARALDYRWSVVIDLMEELMAHANN